MVAYTTTYNLKKPTVADDEDVWGGYLNDSMDLIDDVLDGTTPVTGIDINSGTIDSAVIGGATPAAGTFTTLTANTSLGVTGNITVSGNVDGRDIATDGAKLDGIESGATADQTASEILTAIKTVDGSGSGLDADLLDGVQGSGYARFNSSGTVNNALADAAWVTNYASSSNVDHVWHDDTANAWNFVSDSTFKATANSRVNANSFYANGNVVWNAGNDGSGSGLDADLLDGIQSVDYSRKVMETASGSSSSTNYWAKIATYDISGNYNDGTFLYFFMNEESSTNSAAAILGVTVRTNNVTNGDSNSVNLSIIGMHGTDPFDDDSFKLLDNGSGTDIELWVKKNSNYDHVSVYEHSAHMEGVTVTYNNNAAWQASEPTGTGNNLKSNGLEYRNYKVWHAGNDGSGSGLDADTVDGLQASQFIRSDASDTATGVVTFSNYIKTDRIDNNSGQQLVLNAGESAGQATGQTSEYVYVNAENGLQINCSPDNWSSGWAGRDTFTFSSSGFQFPDGTTQTTAAPSATQDYGLITGSVTTTNDYGALV